MYLHTQIKTRELLTVVLGLFHLDSVDFINKLLVCVVKIFDLSFHLFYFISFVLIPLNHRLILIFQQFHSVIDLCQL